MQTDFTPEQLRDPSLAEANDILRKCMHCGFCTATCPSYLLLGDENDSPRGRIVLIKHMLETGEDASPEVVKHLDRCLSCLACVSTCPSGVNYMHLIDQARVHIEKTYSRPFNEQFLRRLLAFVLPRPQVLSIALTLGNLGAPLQPLLAKLGMTRWASLLSLASVKRPPEPISALAPDENPPALSPKKSRVMLLSGCVQSVVDPAITAAAQRLLMRLGFDVVLSRSSNCCGALNHHMGDEPQSLTRAKVLIDEIVQANVEAVLITASGCGTTIKDYGHLLQADKAYRAKAQTVSQRSYDISEFLARLSLPEQSDFWKGRVSYHAPCSLQHGQKLGGVSQALLRRAGFTVSDIPEGHLCCGSAGVYNILQPELAQALGKRKIEHIASTNPDVIATSNIGCIIQLQHGASVPVVHMISLLDWAYGGPKPSGMADRIKHEGNYG